MSEQSSDPSPNDALRTYETHYPDVVRAGSLQNALQAAADRAGHGLTIALTSSPGWRHVAATVADRDRSANAFMSQHDRTFLVDCWAGGIHMATGSTADLSEVAGAMKSWLSESGLRELVTRWNFLRTWELALAHERGDAIPVRWRRLREAATRMNDAPFQQMVEAAFEQPRLRVLSPGRSMYCLTFSRRAAPPICDDLPRVMPVKHGGYRVWFPDGTLETVDDARQAIALIVDGLPDDAVPWTPAT
ncbi:DUF6193 family natural product biosynthesis protein [Streptomyces fructofermentans]|uniref:DUF6193 family natural product biosynthesis protein n=1 Tax=Streptomyces fructofermentans TaxID=152141 RepID=UPI00378CD31E